MESVMDALYCGFWWSVIIVEMALVLGVVVGTPILIWFLAH